MATFRDLVPRQLPQDELAMPRSARITGETVAEAVARGVKIEYVPILRRDMFDEEAGAPSGEHGARQAIPRVCSGVQARAARLKAIGNGQVPRAAAMAWQYLVSIDSAHGVAR